MRPFIKHLLTGFAVVAVVVAAGAMWARTEIAAYGAAKYDEGVKKGERAALGKPIPQAQLPAGTVVKSMLSIQVEPATARHPYLVIFREKEKGPVKTALVMMDVPPGDKFAADGEDLLVQYKAPKPQKPSS